MAVITPAPGEPKYPTGETPAVPHHPPTESADVTGFAAYAAVPTLERPSTDVITPTVAVPTEASPVYTPPTEAPAPGNPNKKKKTGLFAGLAAAGAVAMGAIGFAATSSSGSEAAKTEMPSVPGAPVSTETTLSAPSTTETLESPYESNLVYGPMGELLPDDDDIDLVDEDKKFFSYVATSNPDLTMFADDGRDKNFESISHDNPETLTFEKGVCVAVQYRFMDKKTGQVSYTAELISNPVKSISPSHPNVSVYSGTTSLGGYPTVALKEDGKGNIVAVQNNRPENVVIFKSSDARKVTMFKNGSMRGANEDFLAKSGVAWRDTGLVTTLEDFAEPEGLVVAGAVAALKPQTEPLSRDDMLALCEAELKKTYVA